MMEGKENILDHKRVLQPVTQSANIVNKERQICYKCSWWKLVATDSI